MLPEHAELVLIEDSPHDREMTLRSLKKARLANPVRVLRDGQEALDHFFGEGVERSAVRRATCAVLLDLNLPGVDGLTVLRRLKEDPITRSIPVIVLTSSAEERDRLSSYDIGANSYVVKPIDFEQFAMAISEIGFYWCVLNAPSEGAVR